MAPSHDGGGPGVPHDLVELPVVNHTHHAAAAAAGGEGKPRPLLGSLRDGRRANFMSKIINHQMIIFFIRTFPLRLEAADDTHIEPAEDSGRDDTHSLDSEALEEVLSNPHHPGVNQLGPNGSTPLIM